MRRLRFQSRRLRGDATLHLAAGLLDRMEREGRHWAPVETGGMLAGYRTGPHIDADIVVTDDIAAGPAAQRTQTRFVPDGEWQQSRLERLYAASDRITTYLGDWHTHPSGGTRPSSTDRHTYQRVADESEARAPYPVILILVLRRRKCHSAAYLLDDGHPIRIRVVEYARR